MKEVPSIYLGRIVSKQNFRVFVYSPDGSQKLVESWDEYEQHMQTGLWFAKKEDAALSLSKKEEEKPKRRARAKQEEEPKGVLGEIDKALDTMPKDDLGFEVKSDDFLPKD